MTPNCELIQQVLPEFEKRQPDTTWVWNWEFIAEDGGGPRHTITGPCCSIGHLLDLAGWRPDDLSVDSYGLFQDLFGVDPDLIIPANDGLKTPKGRVRKVSRILREQCGLS